MRRIILALAGAFLAAPSFALTRPGTTQSPGAVAAPPKPSAPAPTPPQPAAAGKPPAAPSDDAPDPPVTRTVIHTEAYKQRAGLGPHVNFKVTPPEKVGRKRRVLVEIYNYSKVYLNVVDFYLQLYGADGERVEVHIVADDIKPSWSGLKWVRIKGDKPIPKIVRADVQDLQIFNEKGRKVALKAYTDLIKE